MLSVIVAVVLWISEEMLLLLWIVVLKEDVYVVVSEYGAVPANYVSF